MYLEKATWQVGMKIAEKLQKYVFWNTYKLKVIIRTLQTFWGISMEL